MKIVQRFWSSFMRAKGQTGRSARLQAHLSPREPHPHFAILSTQSVMIIGPFTHISPASVPCQCRIGVVRLESRKSTSPFLTCLNVSIIRNIWQRYFSALTLTELSGHVTDKCEWTLNQCFSNGALQEVARCAANIMKVYFTKSSGKN
jgi:hypothetical protein